MVQVFKNLAQTQNPSLAATNKATLVISFYKNTRMLDLVLASLETQTFKNFNLIVCDDGSPSDIVKTVHVKLNQLPIPSLHLWHEDIGFRKNRILNWAIQHTQTDYMVFIDQDCILHPEFMHEHITHQKAKAVLCGRRINLTERVSRFLSPVKIKQHFLENNIWWIILGGLFMKDNNGIKGVYYKNETLRKSANKKMRGIVGCNFSVARQDLLDINGFDTRYEGAGFGEDSDIEFRLSLNGVTMVPFCNTAVQYHVFHKLLTRSNENGTLYDEVVRRNKPQTDFGLKQQLSET
ncbi:MAG: glycosyltransferase [Bdellovibrio sp.]|nr:glycosyltransferase [Bdellovibrio sp.]